LRISVIPRRVCRAAPLEFGNLADSAWLHGLKIVAMAVVAQAVWGMARNLCADPERAIIAVGAAMVALAVPSAPGQIGPKPNGRLAGLICVVAIFLPPFLLLIGALLPPAGRAIGPAIFGAVAAPSPAFRY